MLFEALDSQSRARNSTTMQSMMQHQVESFGQHVFKEGSVVIPGELNVNPDKFYCHSVFILRYEC